MLSHFESILFEIRFSLFTWKFLPTLNIFCCVIKSDAKEEEVIANSGLQPVYGDRPTDRGTTTPWNEASHRKEVPCGTGASARQY